MLLINSSAKIRIIDNLRRGKLANLKNEKNEYFVIIKEDLIVGDIADADLTNTFIKCAHTVYHLADIVAGIDYVFF